MPPHCDTRDGPVVKAAMRALETGNLNHVLIWVSAASEAELKQVFTRTLRARNAGKDAQAVADDWFFETAIRLHRAGEGAPYTGLKPAGLDEGPVVPKAEEAIATGDPGKTIGFITAALNEDLTHRFRDVMAKKTYDVNDVAAGREYVAAFIGWVVYSHHLYMAIRGGEGHGHPAGGHEGGHH